MRFLLAALIFISIKGFAQVSLMQERSDVKWKVIQSDKLKLIFPIQIESKARTIFTTINNDFNTYGLSLNRVAEPITLVLHNDTALANGFVALAPRRSEWFMTPIMDAGISNVKWERLLAIHEMRHVVQLDKINQSTNRWWYYLLGESGLALGSVFSYPRWYAEGDAVILETEFSAGGRGRLGDFWQHYATLWKQGMAIDFDRALLGSYVDYIPNHYVFGYLLTTYLRDKYGDELFDHVLNLSSDTSYNPFSFYNALAAVTQEKIEVHFEALQNKHRFETSAQALLQADDGESAVWTNYFHPLGNENESIALKQGMEDIACFVYLDEQFFLLKELTCPALNYNSQRFGLNQRFLVYQKLVTHPRFLNQTYSHLGFIDLKKNKEVAVIDGHKLFHPWLNEKFLVYVEILPDFTFRVVKYDLEAQKEIDSTQTNFIYEISFPVLLDDSLYALLKDQTDQMSIAKYNNETKDWEHVWGPAHFNLSYLSPTPDGLLFQANLVDFKEGIFHFNLKNNTLTYLNHSDQLSRPSFNQNKVYYNYYTLSGHKVGQTSLNYFESFKLANTYASSHSKNLENKQKALQKNSSSSDVKASLQSTAIRDYHEVDLKFHSWQFIAPPLGATFWGEIIADDYLGRHQLAAGLEYNINEEVSKIYTEWNYQRYWPIFSFKASHGRRKVFNDAYSSDKVKLDSWFESQLDSLVTIPYIRINGAYQDRFSFMTGLSLIQQSSRTNNNINDASDANLLKKQIGIKYSRVRDMAQRELYPRFSQSYQIKYAQGESLSQKDVALDYRAFSHVSFWPGFRQLDRFHLTLDLERQAQSGYRVSSETLFARGYQSVFWPKLDKYSANYVFPLFYPDKAFSRWMYLKRVSFNLFYDYQLGMSNNNARSRLYRSNGVESIFELNILRLEFPLRFGLRFANLIDHPNKSNDLGLFLLTDAVF